MASVDPARMVACCADRAPPARGGLRVVGDGVGDQQHAQSGAAHAPTEIDVIAKQRQGRVEATEAVPHVTPNEHARAGDRDRKSTRLNSSHVATSYAVFSLKKKSQ